MSKFRKPRAVRCDFVTLFPSSTLPLRLLFVYLLVFILVLFVVLFTVHLLSSAGRIVVEVGRASVARGEIYIVGRTGYVGYGGVCGALRRPVRRDRGLERRTL